MSAPIQRAAAGCIVPNAEPPVGRAAARLARPGLLPREAFTRA